MFRPLHCRTQLFERPLFQARDIGAADPARLRGFKLRHRLCTVKPVAQADDARLPRVQAAVKLRTQLPAELLAADLIVKVVLRGDHVHDPETAAVLVGIQRIVETHVARRLAPCPKGHEDLVFDAPAGIGGKAHALIGAIGVDALDEPDAADGNEIVGVVKAYSTCVGEGPFVCELFGQEAARLREAGGEYGAKTGRPRRVGPFDLVATRYGVQVQGASALALTKLDVLSYMKKIPVCTQYELEGKPTDAFPFPAALEKAKPIIEELDGWNCDISQARRWEDLPAAARRYVEFIEEGVGCPIRYVSVGAERDAIILR